MCQLVDQADPHTPQHRALRWARSPEDRAGRDCLLGHTVSKQLRLHAAFNHGLFLHGVSVHGK